MTERCAICGGIFADTAEDAELRERLSPRIAGGKIALPAPTRCAPCRAQLRLAFRNERRLYRRACSSSGKTIVSMYPPDSAFRVFSPEAWWSDAWDARSYGRPFDLARSFSDQLSDLLLAVPRMSLFQSANENCDYCNFSAFCKNCYLIYGWGENSEDCLYGRFVIDCRNCVDVSCAIRCELCYECVDVEDCYRCLYSENCRNCSDSYFLKSCIGCSECFACVNLTNQRYCLFNRRLTPSEYAQAVGKLKQSAVRNYAGFEPLREEIAAFRRGMPQRASTGYSTTDCRGDYLRNCKHVVDSYDVLRAEDCRYVTDCVEVKDCMDLSAAGGNDTELSYECVSLTGQRCLFCCTSWFCHDLLYCVECFNGCHDCFGCVGLRQQSYCVLNLQYSKEEYEQLVPRIVAHMQRAGEWGHFFPAALSPFSYDETMACDYYPLTAEEAKRRGYRWSGREPARPAAAGAVRAEDLPDVFVPGPDLPSILCLQSGRPFRLTAREAAFYSEQELALPRYHPEQRHLRRLAQRNPRRLWQRACARCGATLATTFSPDRSEPVYCEECYAKTVYA